MDGSSFVHSLFIWVMGMDGPNEAELLYSTFYDMISRRKISRNLEEFLLFDKLWMSSFLILCSPSKNGDISYTKYLGFIYSHYLTKLKEIIFPFIVLH